MGKILVEIYTDKKRGDIYAIKEPLTVTYKDKSFTVPAGFECDGASVPRLFQPLVTPKIDPRSIEAATGHDYGYRTNLKGWTKWMLDAMFYQTLVKHGLARWRAALAWLGVFLFGLWSFRPFSVEYERYRAIWTGVLGVVTGCVIGFILKTVY